MFRNTAWRKNVSDAISWHQDQALNTTIFFLKEFGPTRFLLKENEEVKNFKVCLGDPHTCSCPAFQKEKELCKHICWILMRKFRLPRDHEYCFQLGLVERQIWEVLQGFHRVKTPRPTDRLPPEPVDLAEEDGTLRQKDIEEDDVCPICQEELLSKRLPVAHCRYGCGNNIHISCMKVWADHQNQSNTVTTVKCPLCREDFGPMKLLLEQTRNASKLQTSSEREPLNKHLGVLCNNCRILPISGKCYKCSRCKFYHLCEDCMMRGIHMDHVFGIRLKRSQPWVQMQQFIEERKTTEEQSDSELLDNGVMVLKREHVPEAALAALPLVRVRQGGKLLEVGMQCRICLRGFCLGQQVRHLPCHHKFHTDCIDPWLRQSNYCPLDWHTIYNPLFGASAVRIVPAVDVPASRRGKLPDDQSMGLFVPGVGLKDRTMDMMVVKRVESFVSPSASRSHPAGWPLPSAQDLVVNSVRIDQPRRTSDTELAQAQPGRPKPLLRCHSHSHAPLAGQSLNRSGFKAAQPNTRLLPSSGNVPQRPAGAAAPKPQSGESYAGLYVGVSAPDNVVNPAGSVLPRRFKPPRKQRPGGPSGSSSGQVPKLALWMTGMYINIPSPQKN
ncbi:hypothetical protein AALO_G00291730 [Alosa alosa]|uniref:E3 ubiquitin-protein ligase ZSWIM2 n=1 Tax=Alosa alosa TaxID=278164 RepID=A0AAV6FLI8_9TELE|nr:E3 ubiquitin-protein ligase ZSWIM2 [Alosa alosa]KAG5262062.1 hypothetical protein AALO_G00291730 [Alosa alosa]